MEIPNYPKYKIYENGDVINVRGKKLKQQKDKDGYMVVYLSNQCKRKIFKIHRLLCQLFKQPVEGCNLVDHVDRNRQNNSLDNLRWVDFKTNSNNRNLKHTKLGCESIGEMTSRGNDYWIIYPNQFCKKKTFNKKKYTLNQVKDIFNSYQVPS